MASACDKLRQEVQDSIQRAEIERLSRDAAVRAELRKRVGLEETQCQVSRFTSGWGITIVSLDCGDNSIRYTEDAVGKDEMLYTKLVSRGLKATDYQSCLLDKDGAWRRQQ